MIKYSSLFVFMLVSLTSFGQEIIEPCKFGQPLIDALQDSYTPSDPIGYNPARDILYSTIDNNGLQLSGIYTDFTVTLEAGADPSVSAFQNGAGINAEHVYPQSLGAGNEPAKSDLHNIFPSKVNVNSARGSCPFGEVDDEDTDLWFYQAIQANNIPLVDLEKYSEKDEEDCQFEPRESVKGDIARAMFYFYAIYQSIADGINSNFFNNQKAILYQWHLNDPPTTAERQRSSLIAAEQGNENPFVQDTSLVRRAFFEADASYPVGDPNCHSLTTSTVDLNQDDWYDFPSNIIQDEIVVYAQQPGQLFIYTIQGQLIRTQSLQLENKIDVTQLPQGMFVLHLYSAGKEKALWFFKS